MEPRGHHLDTTSCALRGDDVPERAEQAMRLTPGDSKDHRPDLKPAVVAWIVSPDGGVPLVRTSWDGQASETQMFQERAPALIKAWARSPTPRQLVAEAKRDPEDPAAPRATLGVITRMPGTLTLVSQVSSQALPWGTWPALQDTTRDQGLAWCHDGIAPRWLVVSSPAALERAEARVTHAPPREWAPRAKPLVHVHAPRVETPEAAQAALAVLATSWRAHPVATTGVIEHQRDAGQGRPPPTSPITSRDWQIRVQARPDQERIAWRKPQGAGVVLGTHLDASHVSASPVLQAYKAHSQVESGCRLLKAPLCLVAALLVKPPCRMPGRLMVMT
jgi:hypothetical protein